MTESKLQTAKILAKNHYRVEPNLKRVFLLESSNERDRSEPIKLLEVVEGTLERGIEPVAFASSPENGIMYPSLIVEVSPEEYKTLRRRPSALKSHGWRVGIELAR